MRCSRSFIRVVAAMAMWGLLAAMLAPGSATASGPPSPPPYPKLFLHAASPPFLECRDSDGRVIYTQGKWSLEPLLRGPLFAPVVLWLQGRANAPVMPLEFASTAYPLIWTTADGGPAEGGLLERFGGRPVGYGPAPSDPALRVTCTYGMLGHSDFGTYVVTAGLATTLGLPSRLVGRTLHFEGEGDVTFSVPRYLFPLTAGVRLTTLPTPDRPTYGKRALPSVVCGRGATTVYRGPAYTLPPLVRGYQWAPMAFWLDGDRIVTPAWFLSSVQGTWRTVSGSPARSGQLDAVQSGRPGGYGRRPASLTAGVYCRWSGPHRTTTTVSAALASQLELPSDLIGRRVAISGTATVNSYTPDGLFPPSS